MIVLHPLAGSQEPLIIIKGTKLSFDDVPHSLPQIHANCRIRRVYFSDRLYSEDELPAEFKLYLPVQNKSKVMVKLFCMFN